MPTFAVTGAAGSLGQRVVARLGAEDSVERVVGLDRAEAVEWPRRWRFHQVELGATDVAPLLQGVDGVAHLAWTEDGSSDPAANLEATRRVLDGAARAGVGSLVFVSCATVYGAWPDNPVPLVEDEALRPNPGFGNAAEKAEAERMVTEWAAEHAGAAVTILRPALILGDGPPGPLARSLLPVLTIRGRGEGPPVQVADVDDVAAAVVLGLQGRTSGVLNVASDGWMGDEDVRSLVGARARLPLSRRIVERAGGVLHWVRGGRSPQEAAPFSRHPLVIANDRLRAAGWVPAHSNEEALIASPLISKWPELSPKRRQELALGVAGALLASAVAATVGLVRRARRRG